MNRTIQLVVLVAVIVISGTSCKKNWTCSRTYPGDPNNPNSAKITQTKEITAKRKREAKLECEAFADPGDTWELQPR